MVLPTSDALVRAISMPGPGELVLILLIVLVVFGHNRIPQLGDALGKGIKNFRKSFAKDESETQPSERVERPSRQIPEDPSPEAEERLAEKKEDSKVA